jgi:[protein-PII] uridylyltransferase
VAQALLGVRHIAGDITLTDRLARAARTAWRTRISARLPEVVDATRDRWRRFGAVAHRTEPDIKNGRGGLRDLTVVDALAATQLADRPRPEARAAHQLLLDVRTEAHLVAGRAGDVLRAQDGDEVAAALGMADRFELLRALSGAGRVVAHTVEDSIRAVRSALPARGLVGPRRPRRVPLDDGVVRHGDEVTLARDADPAHDPALPLRSGAAAGRTGLSIAPATLTRLRDRTTVPAAPWPRWMSAELVALLGTGPGVVDVIEALDRVGLWARWLPEWDAVRDLPPREPPHVWTVDRHLVETVVHVAPALTGTARPDLLVLAALMHDLGKGLPGDHSETGAVLADRICRRIGLWPDETALVTAAVRHHLLLPDTATRRDLTDPATVPRVVAALGGDPVLLELTHALARADALATGPGVWSSWKAATITDLVERCRRVMAGEHSPAPPSLTADERAMAERGRTDLALAPGPDEHSITVTVVGADRARLLTAVTGVLAMHSLDVHATHLRVHAGNAVEVFTVTPRFGSPPPVSLLRQQLRAVLAGSLRPEERLAAKERDYGGPPTGGSAPKVLWFDDESGIGDVLELRAPDRIGLLHRVASVLERLDVGVRWARSTTYGDIAVGSFCLHGIDGTPLDEVVREKITAAVSATLNS